MAQFQNRTKQTFLQLLLDNPKYVTYGLLGLLVLVGILITIINGSTPEGPTTNENSLALAQNAKIKGQISIPLVRSVNLNGQTRDQIFELRSKVVAAHGNLLQGNYIPFGEVFGAIEDNLPWFSIPGYYAYGPGPFSTKGDGSEESRYIMNPFILVGAEFWGLSAWKRKGIKWDQAKVDETMVEQHDFPLYPKPESLSWYPEQARGEITYDVTTFIDRVNQYNKTPLNMSDINFGTVAYNARDLGMNYLWYSKDKSVGVTNPKDHGQAIRIIDRLERNDVCKIDGGCNHVSGGATELDFIQAQGLPATATIFLWRNEPTSVQQAPDMTWGINLR